SLGTAYNTGGLAVFAWGAGPDADYASVYVFLDTGVGAIAGGVLRPLETVWVGVSGHKNEGICALWLNGVLATVNSQASWTIPTFATGDVTAVLGASSGLQGLPGRYSELVWCQGSDVPCFARMLSRADGAGWVERAYRLGVPTKGRKFFFPC